MPIGRTLKTKDEYLPVVKSVAKVLKDKRWVVVIDKNKKNEFAVVRLTTKKSKNSTLLEDYKKGNKEETYFRHFVEIKDNEGKPITINEKFISNKKENDLNKGQVKQIQNKVFHKIKQSKGNIEKIKTLKGKL